MVVRAAITIALLSLLACVKGSRDYTQPAVEVREAVVVTAAATADAIAEASLMIFDEQGDFVARMELTAGDLGREIPLPDALQTRAAGERFRIVVWGNAESNADLVEQTPAGHTIASQFLGLKCDTRYTDNWKNPGNIYFGQTEISTGQSDGVRTSRTVHSVQLAQKTARMAVSVRGLPAGADEDYYFSMCEQNDGFTFDGVPLKTNQWCKVRENGVFNAAGDFVTPEPYHVIPSADPNDEAGCTAGVCLYKVGGGLATRLSSDTAGYVTEDGDLNLTGKARVDTEGNHLALTEGKTTNVLLTFGPAGDVEVRIAITDWDEAYQWGTWLR